jgi:hypothetical protein
MPRQIRDVRLQTREARRKLVSAKEPYWREVRRGLHVGYYKGHDTGTWWLREIREGRRQSGAWALQMTTYRLTARQSIPLHRYSRSPSVRSAQL